MIPAFFGHSLPASLSAGSDVVRGGLRLGGRGIGALLRRYRQQDRLLSPAGMGMGQLQQPTEITGKRQAILDVISGIRPGPIL